ncbi:hypothetical protein F7R91_20950 [Streptomyces luteolifulvus]|uniref:Uncharacterized protein n=1 Tax=Streptomyces luteolifulvus TaxID=2615112 RepID=A0A6H9UZI1_9ACTN|nr:hypothetical protein [Streptomyces luteolifulvus]KAB1144710.1 hypothetical protein F7R91_20950 [Streptomyces luteolifulvus]
MWTTLAPLIGVVLGGLMSWLAQHSVGRASKRAARRDERLTRLIDFLSAVQEAERAVVDRYHNNLADEQWQARARQTIDRVWVTQKTIHMVCEPEVNDAAREVAFTVQKLMREGPVDTQAPQDEKVWAAVSPSRRAFLDVAHRYLR